MDILTPEVIVAALGLATTVATGLFAWYLKRYGDEKGKRQEAEDQGDIIMKAARGGYGLAVALYGANPKAEPYLYQAKQLLDAIEDGWNNAKVGTPEMEEYYEQLSNVLTALGKELAKG